MVQPVFSVPHLVKVVVFRSLGVAVQPEQAHEGEDGLRVREVEGAQAAWGSEDNL
jgi:hypothetical protein